MGAMTPRGAGKRKHLRPCRVASEGHPMKSILGALAVSLFLGTTSFAMAGPKEEVAAATHAWAEAFNSRNPERVLALYDSEAVLWGTISPTLRDTPDAIRDYFK